MEGAQRHIRAPCPGQEHAACSLCLAQTHRRTRVRGSPAVGRRLRESVKLEKERPFFLCFRE